MVEETAFDRRRGVVERPFPRSSVERDEYARAARDLRRLAPCRSRDLVDLPIQFAEAHRRVAVPVVPGVPGVDVRQRELEQTASTRPDHQRRPASGRRQQDRVVDAMKPTTDGDALARHQAPDDLEGLGETRDARVERHAERAELRLVPAGAHGADEATVTDLVDGRSHPREDPGRMERRTRDERAQLHAAGRRRERSEHRPHVPGSALAAIVVSIEEMVAEPDGVEARLLRRTRHGDVLRPPHDPLDLGQLDPDAERTRHHSCDNFTPRIVSTTISATNASDPPRIKRGWLLFRSESQPTRPQKTTSPAAAPNPITSTGARRIARWNERSVTQTVTRTITVTAADATR